MIPQKRQRRLRDSLPRKRVRRRAPSTATPKGLHFENLEQRIALSSGATCRLPFATDALVSPLREDVAQATHVGTLDAGNSRDTALDLGPVNGTRAVSGYVGGADPRDFYRFELTGDVEVDVSLTGLAQDIDLYLFDAAAHQVGQSIRPGRQSESIARSLAAGTYHVLIAPFGNQASSYRLTLEATPTETAPVGGDGNSFRDARDLGSLDAARTLEDRVGDADPADYYRFRLDSSGVVEIVLTGLEEDIDLYLLSTDGRELTRSWNGNTSAESIRQPLTAGEYVVLVKPWGAAESEYSLSLQAQPNQPAPSPTPAPEPTPDPIPDPGPGADEPYPDVDDFGGANDWNLNHVNAPEVWAQGFTGEGVVVAVVDTGVDSSHRELSSNIWVNPGEIPGNGIDDDGNGFVDDRRGWDFVAGDNDPNDGNGHGTHVAGTIAAANDGFGSTGVAPGATIMPVRVLDSDGAGSIYDVAAGIRYAVDNGADVINLSLGGGYSSTLLSSLIYAGQNGVFVVAAAGNAAGATPAYPAAFSAELTHVLSVGAHDSLDAKASFSNSVGASGAVQVAAPGVGIYSTLPDNRYGRSSGTSMAAPHVAGLAALALSANTALAPEAVRSLIVDGADRLIAGSDSFGGVNAAASVASAERSRTAGQNQSAVAATAPSGSSPSTITRTGSSPGSAVYPRATSHQSWCIAVDHARPATPESHTRISLDVLDELFARETLGFSPFTDLSDLG